MKAALLYKNDPLLRIEDVEAPQILGGEALLKIQAAGVCRTDLKLIHGFLRPGSYPHILGHEISAKVVDSKPSNPMESEIIENAARTNGNVLVYPDIGCGRCSFCLKGEMNMCDKLKRPGFEIFGGFAEYAKIPISNLVPTFLGADAAILTDAGAAMMHALKKVNPAEGMAIVVAGVGGLGTMAIQLANLFGCDAIALDVDDRKLSYAVELGASASINVLGRDEEQVRAALLKNLGRTADVFVDLVGNGSNQKMALKLLSRNGKLLQVGYSDASLAGIQLKEIVYNELQVIGSLACSIMDLKDVIALASSDKLKLNVTRRYQLEEINDAISDLETNQILGRSVIVPQ